MKKHATRIGIGLSILLSMVGAGCSEDEPSGHIRSIESQPDGVLRNGEVLTPEMECTFKHFCSEDIDVEWEVCLTEKAYSGEEFISKDLNGREICAAYSSHFTCHEGTLVKASTTCFAGYCPFTMVSGSGEPITCGWKLNYFAAYNADGSFNSDLTPENLEEFGWEQIPLEN